MRDQKAGAVELPGEDHLPFLGNQDEILVEIERFISRARVRTTPERVLATVLTVVADAPKADAEAERDDGEEGEERVRRRRRRASRNTGYSIGR